MTVNNFKEKETPQRERGKLLFNALPNLFRHPLFNLSMVGWDLKKSAEENDRKNVIAIRLLAEWQSVHYLDYFSIMLIIIKH